MISGKRILILAPHTDDGELGCGGTISNLLETNEVFYVAFSSCRHSVPSAFSPDILQSELITATRHLGIKQENVKLLDYEVRRFNYQRQEILDDMLNIRKDIAPDIVFMPSTTDLHQDHFTITSEGVRAFKYSTILSYELPWNNIVFSPKCYIALREEDLHKKCSAVTEYKSQAHRDYTSEEFIRSLAKVRGLQMGKSYAEAFEVVRWII